jgi:hypothetical protein
MKKGLIWLAVAVLAVGTLALIRPGGPRSGPGGGDVYCAFEEPALWDISPEWGFTLERSTEHVTEGTGSLKVVFPGAEYPSINTKKLRQPAARYHELVFDVFNPQEHPVKFGVRVEDRQRKRVTFERTLEPGENRISIGRDTLERTIDPAALFFVVLFIDDALEDPLTLYFDNMRLAAAIQEDEPAAPADPAPPVAQEGHEGRADRTAEPPAAVAELAAEPPLPNPAPKRAPATAGELTLAVVKLRPGTGPDTLVSQGVPFAPGQLKSERDVAFLSDGGELPLGVKVLARWPQDDSIRSLLVQFRLDPARLARPVIMRWGAARTAADIPEEPVAWEIPEGFIMLPPRWLSDSEVIGEQVPMGDHDFPDYDGLINQYYPDRREDPRHEDIREDGYYSTPHVFYQLYLRSGDVDTFLAARREALYYRDHELILDGPDRGRHKTYGETRYMYVEALVDDYLLTGDERSKEVAGWMAAYLKRVFPPSKAFYPKHATNFWTERVAAFPFMGIMHWYGITGDPEYRKAADEIMENLYKMQRQWPGRGGFIHNLYAHDSEEGCREDEYGGSPFMTGLLLEPIIEYHRLTGSVTAARSIFLALDWLMREGLAGSGDMFLYLTCDMHEEDQDPTPDLNFLVVHGFGYGYRLSGYQRQDYMDLSRRLMERGVADAFLKNRKHFNQNFRSSGHFLAYVQGAPSTAAAIASADPNVFFHDDFNDGTGRWASPGGDAAIEHDRNTVFAGGGALQVTSAFPASKLTAGWSVDGWDLERHPAVRFAYKIPRGVPVGLRVQTQFGDWVSLGGTVGQPDESAPGGEPRLIDDGEWHDTVLDVGQAFQRVLPGIRILTAFRFEASSDVGADRRFWVDEFHVGN